MARLNFVRGAIKGRVGEFVGSSWKGTDYIKTFTPPSNPRTQGQVAVRTVFHHVTHIAALINESVLKPYTFPKPHKMTPTNRMVHINQEMFHDKVWEPSKLKIFDGGLHNPGITTAVLNGVGTISVEVQITWVPAFGLGTDKGIGIIYDEISEKAVVSYGDRSTGSITVPIGFIDQPDMSKLHAYLAFVNPPAPGTGETGQVSGTAYFKVPAP